MTEFKLGQLVSFSEKRGTLRYKLAPYGEKARDRDVTFAEGSIDFSEAEGAIVNVEHDPFRPIGKLSNFESKADGLYATVTLADTTLGRDTFTEAKEGLRSGVSIEVSEMQPTTGLVTFARLSGAGIVVNPALGSARLISAFSEDVTEEETLNPSEPEQPEEETTAEAEAEAETPIEKEDIVSETPAAVPSAFAATGPQVTLSYEALAAARKDSQLKQKLVDSGLAGETNVFALSNVTGTANTANIEQPTFLGELWSGNRYTRKYAPLVSSGVLTDWKVEGFKFVGDLLVDTYAGDLAEIPSNAVTTVPVSEEAVRCAHGMKVDRKYRDFNNAQFLQSLFEKQTEGYAKLSDQRVLTRITTSSTQVTASASIPGVAVGLSRIVDGALAILKDLDALPTFAIVSFDLYREMLLTTEFDNLKFISTSLGLEEGSVNGLQIIPSSDIPNNTVYVGHKNALQFFELGGSPIRVEAEDVSHGGLDEAVFGYTAFIEHEAKGIVKVVPAA